MTKITGYHCPRCNRVITNPDSIKWKKLNSKAVFGRPYHTCMTLVRPIFEDDWREQAKKLLTVEQHPNVLRENLVELMRSDNMDELMAMLPEDIHADMCRWMRDLPESTEGLLWPLSDSRREMLKRWIAGYDQASRG